MEAGIVFCAGVWKLSSIVKQRAPSEEVDNVTFYSRKYKNDTLNKFVAPIATRKDIDKTRRICTYAQGRPTTQGRLALPVNTYTHVLV